MVTILAKVIWSYKLVETQEKEIDEIHSSVTNVKGVNIQETKHP